MRQGKVDSVASGPGPELSLIVAVDDLTSGAARSIADIRAVAGDISAVEVIAAPRHPWADAPAGVTVIPLDSQSRGDRFDRAAEAARGSLLAFIDSRMRLRRDWVREVRRLFADPAVGVAGGPVLPRSKWRSERISALLLRRQLGLTPLGHVARRERARPVRELAGSNLVIRRELFTAVGGFQSPSAGGEAARLCFKLRSLLGREIRYDPALALSATAPRFPGSFLADIAGYGRVRGDLSRRCRDVAPLVPYSLPFLALLCLAGELALVGLHRWRDALIGSMLMAGAYIVQALSILVSRGRLSDRLLAALSAPLVPMVYGAAYVRGFLGHDLGEISPRRTRRRPVRVLILNWRDVTHPWAGGAETYMHEIGRRWAARGIEVGWLCQRSKGQPRVETIDGIRVHRVGGRLTQYLAAPLAWLLRLRGRYDVIVDCENGIPFFTPLFTRRPKLLVVHHVHREIFRRETRPPFRWIGYWLEGWLMPRLYRCCPVVAVSESTRDDLVRLGFDSARITVVHNGVKPVEIRERELWPLPGVAYFGRLTPQKRIDVLIRALSHVLNVFPDVRLDIIGQGPDRQRLERMAWALGLAGQVRFHGYVSDSRRDAILARAWVAVCPSLLEGWGITCMEASVRGIPVIASNVNGLRDSVIDGVTGILVPASDPLALAVSLTELLGDPQKRAAMGAAGVRWAQQHSWDETAGALARVLGDVMVGDAEPAAAVSEYLLSWS